MKRLLVFNLATDADDPILGFAVGWLVALAGRVGHVDVVTMRAGRSDLPPNVAVFSVGKERGYGEPRRAWEFYRLLAGLLRRNRYDACFAHMMPLFALLGWPLLRARSVPTTLWYAHRATGPVLRLAAGVVDAIVTPSVESFRVASPKVRVVGHGIDVSSFQPVAAPEVPPCRIVVVGRVSPVKRLEIVVEALPSIAEGVGGAVSLHLVGPADVGYAARLRDLARHRGCQGDVVLHGPVSHREVAAELAAATVAVNVSATGSVDKAVLEAMASSVPVVVANEAFAFLPEECRAEPTPGAVAAAVIAMASLPATGRAALGGRLRAIVERDHSLDRLVDLLVDDVLAGRAR
ncbi:MAG TPA: glycosyltransferase [Acidimicrobiales bacterium]|nr:glycosyltransferase [Acidimicrobiales bacterium]